MEGPVLLFGNNIDILSGLSISFGSSFSISMWLIVLSHDSVILSLGRTDSSIGNGFLLSVNADGYVEFIDYDTLSGVVTYGFSGRSLSKLVVSNARQHLVLVKDGLTATFYINGAKSGTITSSKNIVYNTQPLVLGGDVFTHSNYFKGQIDSLLIYNGSLSNGDIQKIAKSAGNLLVHQKKKIYIYILILCAL